MCRHTARCIYIFMDCIGCIISCKIRGLVHIKMSSYQYRKSDCGDKTILRPSYLHNGMAYNGKMTPLYWIRAQTVTELRQLGKHLWLAYMSFWRNFMFIQTLTERQLKDSLVLDEQKGSPHVVHMDSVSGGTLPKTYHPTRFPQFNVQTYFSGSAMGCLQCQTDDICTFLSVCTK